MTAAKVVSLNKVTSWSFSRYSLYRQCPAKFKYKVLDRLPEPSSPALDRGAAIHTQAEHYLKGATRRLPAELKLFSDTFKDLRKRVKQDDASVVVEDTWAFTQAWEPTRWDDWTNCWLRIKLDCAHVEADDTLVVSDWKTGKAPRQDLKQEYLEQLELYALGALLTFKSITEVRPRLVYLDSGTVYPDPRMPVVYVPADVPALQRTWLKRVKPLFSDKIFAPKPNDKCCWCAYSRSKGGPCKF